MVIEIEIEDRRLAFEIMDTPEPFRLGRRIDVPGNATLIPKSVHPVKTSEFPATVTFVLAFGSGAASHRVANWLYENIASRATRVEIDRSEIEGSPQNLEKIIQERVRRICP
jgi:hypothetical protein